MQPQELCEEMCCTEPAGLWGGPSTDPCVVPQAQSMAPPQGPALHLPNLLKTGTSLGTKDRKKHLPSQEEPGIQAQQLSQNSSEMPPRQATSGSMGR